MGKRKIICNNNYCKHHISGGGCDTCITLDGLGKCKSFEKGFAYYFHIVWDALGNKNFIDMIEVHGMLLTGIFGNGMGDVQGAHAEERRKRQTAEL